MIYPWPHMFDELQVEGHRKWHVMQAEGAIQQGPSSAVPGPSLEALLNAIEQQGGAITQTQFMPRSRTEQQHWRVVFYLPWSVRWHRRAIDASERMCFRIQHPIQAWKWYRAGLNP